MVVVVLWCWSRSAGQRKAAKAIVRIGGAVVACRGRSSCGGHLRRTCVYYASRGFWCVHTKFSFQMQSVWRRATLNFGRDVNRCCCALGAAWNWNWLLVRSSPAPHRSSTSRLAAAPAASRTYHQSTRWRAAPAAPAALAKWAGCITGECMFVLILSLLFLSEWRGWQRGRHARTLQFSSRLPHVPRFATNRQAQSIERRSGGAD